MNIQEIMSKPAITCGEDDSLHYAARLMWEHDCGAITVTDGHGCLVGIITDRDICMATFTQGKPPQDIRVHDAMAKEVFTGHFNDSLEDIEELMANRQIRRVPIVDGNQRPIGVVSMNDIARFSAGQTKKSGLEHQVSRTLAAISRPHTAIQPAPARALIKRETQARS